MKIVFISDTHSLHTEMSHPIPNGDVLVFCGDMCNSGKYPNEVKRFADWFASFPHRHKICIAGNHDGPLQTTPDLCKSMFPSSVHYLQDQELIIDGVKFYGSPWTPTFYYWWFMLDRGSPIRDVWNMIPDDVDVLITHGPAAGILDKVKGGPNVGCVDLLERIKELKKLKIAAFGHIHEAYGEQVVGGYLAVNASTCNEHYDPINPPIVVDL